MSDIADAIRAKNGTSDTYKPAEMAAAISAIQTGTDTSDATATAAVILDGFTAYANDAKLTGSMPNGEEVQF